MKNSKLHPAVSVGVPVYNGEKYLEECLDSILNQTFEDWECVIIDNCCTDCSNEIAKRFVASDRRFKLFKTDDVLPITENWNFCYSKTNHDSKYFKIVPADDWLFPQYLAEMVELMDVNPQVGFCSSYIIDDKEASCDGLDIRDGRVFDGKEMLIKHLKGELLVFGSANAVLFSNPHLQKLSCYPEIFREETFHMDTYLCYELLNVSDMGFIFQVLSYTRRHNETVTSSVARVLKTYIFFYEKALYDFKHLDAELEIVYQKVRLRYAFLLLSSRIKSKRQVTDWHGKNLQRPISSGEYLQAVIKRVLHRL